MTPLIIGLAVVALVVPAAALADDLPRDDSRLLMRDYARCMASQHGSDAKRFMELDPVAPLSREQLCLLHSDCMPRIIGILPPQLSLSGNRTHYRYALAEALFVRAYRRSPPVIAAGAPPLAHPAIAPGSPRPADWSGDAAAWGKLVESSQQDARMSAFGECVVRNSPNKAWALLKSDVASKAEMDAFVTLKPTLAGCLASDRNVQLSRFNMRGSIALSYYRLANVASAHVRAERGR